MAAATLTPFSKSSFLAFILLLLLITLCTTKPIRRFYAQSSSDFEILVKFESNLALNLTQTYLSKENSSTDSEIRRFIKPYLLDFHEGCGFAKIENRINQTKIPVVRNSICAYRLLKRVQYLLTNLLSKKSFRLKLGRLWRNIIYFFLKNGRPLFDDIEFVTDGILRLNHIYDVDLKQFANGKISRDYATNCTLNSLHSYEISQIAIKRRNFASAIEWLELAKERTLADHQTSVPFIEFLLWKAIEEHNGNLDEELLLHMEPTYFNRKILHVSQDSKNATKIRNIQLEAFKGKIGRFYDDVNYLRLCSGQSHQIQNKSSILFCWYETKIHWSLTISPIKMEFLGRNPDVVQMYEIIHDKAIKPILAEARSKLIPSMVGGKPVIKSSKLTRLSESVNTMKRTAVIAWYSGKGDVALSKKIEHVTGLRVLQPTAGEKLQVASYSFAGHYIPHLDSNHAMPDPLNIGQRIATFMLYNWVYFTNQKLNDVDDGGATVFTSLGIVAKPEKGSALFWFNLHRDGSEDGATVHAACPVVIGQKWAANKWIHFHDQFLTMKCGLKRDDRFRVSVNGKES